MLLSVHLILGLGGLDAKVLCQRHAPAPPSSRDVIVPSRPTATHNGKTAKRNPKRTTGGIRC
ncbi:hypothetical protein BKA81DRAFT_374043 [Phyllosticta paracitricarpa]